MQNLRPAELIRYAHGISLVEWQEGIAYRIKVSTLGPFRVWILFVFTVRSCYYL